MFKKEKLSSEDKETLRKQREIESEKLILDGWQKNSELGQMKYALKFGAFTWALPTFAIYSVIMIVLNRIIEDSVKYNLYQALFSLFFFVVFGTFYGTTIWKKNEKIYRNKFPYGKKASKSNGVKSTSKKG